MATGNEILEQLRRQQCASQTDLLTLTDLHQANVDALAQAQADTHNALQQVASTRLDALAARELLQPLGEADAQARQALDVRTAEQARVAAQLQENAANQREARAECAARDAREKACCASADAALEALLTTMRSQQGFADAETAAADARELADRTHARLAELEQLRVDHAPAFESDPQFMYLWRRAYGTAAYRGWGLARALDGWLARRISFADEAAKYRELTEVPGALGRHVAELRADADAKQAAVAAQVEAAMPRDPAGTAREVFRTAQREAAEAHAHLAALGEAQAALEAERTRLATQTDENSVRARLALYEALGALDRAALVAAASSTRSRDDDDAVARLVTLRERLPQLEATLAASASALDAQQAKATEVAGVIAEFRQRGFDAGNARFSGVDVDELLLGYLTGRRTRQSFWSEVSSRHSVYTPPAPRPSSSSSGGYRTSSSFGGGSSRSSSRSGGYRTSGSF